MKFYIFMLLFSITSLANVNDVDRAQKLGVDLSSEEREILESGKIEGAQKVVGGIVGSSVGFGLGHVIQGRWKKKGWIFTAGQTATAAIALLGSGGCDGLGSEGDEDDDDFDDWDYTNAFTARSSHDEEDDEASCSAGNALVILAGLGGFVAFKVWEIVDVWSGAKRHNTQYDSIKGKIDSKAAEGAATSVYLVPMVNKRGTGLALTMSF